MTEDRTADGRWVPGGPSLYSARMAHALGARVTLITAMSDSFDRSCLADINVVEFPTETLPRYANSYDTEGNRTQLLLNPGPQLNADDFPEMGMADVLMLAPAYHELQGFPPVRAKNYAVALQGPLRATEGDRIVPNPDLEDVTQRFLRPGVFAFLSEEDTPNPDAFAVTGVHNYAVVVVTRGYRGATLYSPGVPQQLPAVEANPVDPTGAGDCFATAFMVRLAETGDVQEACRFGLAAGALTTEGKGIEGVPARHQVVARLAEEAAI